jgi:anti-anti-sigma regulatory factor
LPITAHGEGGATTITLVDRVDLYQADELKKALLEALADSREVVIDVGSLASTDLSVMQIFCAAHKQAVRQGLELRLAGASQLREYAVASGHSRKNGCLAGCLWTSLGEE